ncbi:FAD-dependent oxidoreductase [Larkinella terrae]|uniref:FAD-dependent oxidoreductase n=1 Tax=Larkinella terrae TaxID=2025311 RepID=A0A7K0EM12_9BACT|nr:FAD-dependent oxidoreductase [Larkinella terrae]MRS62877.1 FAD-dependent oxidoreductase [Larkinella terrae]
MKRRELLGLGIMGSILPVASSTGLTWGNESNRRGASVFQEPAKKLTVVEDVDVIVCGGGPAGVAAAIASARNGAKTRLIEFHGCLGGIWTAGLLCNLIEHENKGGIMQEILDALNRSGAQVSATNYDAEAMKVILDQLCKDAGVDVRLHTRVVAAYTNSKKRLETIVTESQSGREAWRAKTFIDTTGNGDLAAQAGCSFVKGHPTTGLAQPASMMAILTGITKYDMVRHNLISQAGVKGSQHKINLREEIRSVGMDPSYGMPTLFLIRDDLFAMMANHQYNMNSLDAQDITQATMESRSEVYNMVDKLRKKGGIWSDLRIVATSEQIGLREGRRIKGLYTVNREDLIKGSRFEDAVCRVKFAVDIHSVDGKGDKGYGSEGIKVQPYDIPLRSLIASEVGGLMMAGRCISGDFFAHASYRVTGNAVAMGEAAGKVAAKASLTNRLAHEVQWKEVNKV